MQEVIELTQELISGRTGPGSSGQAPDNGASKPGDLLHQAEELTQYAWKVGDNCMAVYTSDGRSVAFTVPLRV